MADMRVTLEACRVNTGMTQAQFAEQLGVSMNTISNWERGNSEPNLTQLRKISELSTIPMGSIVMGNSSF